MIETIFDWLNTLIINSDIYLVFIILPILIAICVILIAICVELLWRFK